MNSLPGIQTAEEAQARWTQNEDLRSPSPRRTENREVMTQVFQNQAFTHSDLDQTERCERSFKKEPDLTYPFPKYRQFLNSNKRNPAFLSELFSLLNEKELIHMLKEFHSHPPHTPLTEELKIELKTGLNELYSRWSSYDGEHPDAIYLEHKPAYLKAVIALLGDICPEFRISIFDHGYIRSCVAWTFDNDHTGRKNIYMDREDAIQRIRNMGCSVRKCQKTTPEGKLTLELTFSHCFRLLGGDLTPTTPCMDSGSSNTKEAPIFLNLMGDVKKALEQN